MDGIYEELRELIAQDLRAIGARLLKDTVYGQGMIETSVCFFAVADKTVAITHAPRDGFTCYIGGPATGDLLWEYETWPTLWHLLGLDKDTETEAGLREYLRRFPNDSRDYIKFMGACLVKYFRGVH